MFTLIKSASIDREQIIYGISTDTKPIGKIGEEAVDIQNGCVFYCMDDKTVSMYDKENEEWLLQ